MYCFRLTRRIYRPGGVPKGFVLQVTSSGGTPAFQDLEKALKAAGFSDKQIHDGGSLQLSEWEVKRL